MSRSLTPKFCRELLDAMPPEFIKFHLTRLLTWQMEKGNPYTHRLGWFVSLMEHHRQKNAHAQLEQAPATMKGDPQDMASLLAQYIEG